MDREDKKINDFIKEYRVFLSNNQIDIAKSTIENEWFVYRYEKRYGYYEYFIRFYTVLELVDIILDEMKHELYCAIGKEIAPPECEDYELADTIKEYYEEKEMITEFTILLDMVVNSELGKNSEFFQMLNRLCKIKEKAKDGKGVV